MITTLTEWKARLQPGTQIRQIRNAREGRVDKLFTIKKLQTNAVKFYPNGYIDFPKRADIEFTEKGWKRFEKGKLLSEYEWVEGENL